jgi:NitT/TauT family transport system ATP-binding protein
MEQKTDPEVFTNHSNAFCIELRNVSMAFHLAAGTPKRSKRIISVKEKEFVTLIGPSGCGKTTILRIIADLIKPTEGQVIVSGGTPREARKSRLIGYVFQDPALLAWRTVTGNIHLPLEIMDRGDQEQYAQELLELVGLDGFAEHYLTSSRAVCNSEFRLLGPFLSIPVIC